MTDFKEGDKVRVVFEGVVHKDGLQFDYVSNLLDFSKSIELIERAGRPLEVGERVIFRHQERNGSVVSAYGRAAWVLFDNSSLPDSIGISLLTRPCGTPITEAKS